MTGVSRGPGPAAGPAPGPRVGEGPVGEGPVGEPHGRSRSPWKAAFFVLAAVGIVAGVAWALLGSKLLVVRSVEVTGTHLVPQAEVLAVAGLPRGLPLIRVDTAAIASRVDRITQVESAHVSREWPDHVLIAVRERTPALAVAASGGYDLIDRFGVVVRWTGRRPQGMPLYLPSGASTAGGVGGSSPQAGSAGGVGGSSPQAGTALRGSPEVAVAVAVLHELPPRIVRHLADLAAPGPASVTLHLSGGVTIIWGGTDRPGEKSRELGILMRTPARLYDVSAPGTAVTG